MTTFDGAGVRSGPLPPPSPPPPPLLLAERQLAVHQAEASRRRRRRARAARSPGATYGRAGPSPYGSRAVAVSRAGARRGHAGAPAGAAASAASAAGGAATGIPARRRIAAASGCMPDVATSRISSWSDSKPPNVRLISAGDDVDPVALVRRSRRGPAGRTRSRRGRRGPRFSVSWVWPPAGLADARHREAEHGDERLRVADAARGEPRAGRGGGRSRPRAPAAPGRSRAARRGSAGARRRGERAELLDELRPALGRDLEAGGAGVAAVAEEQRRALLERGAQVERAVAPARGPDDRPQLRADDRRPPEVVDEPRRDEPDDPDRPRAADDRRRRRSGGSGERVAVARRPSPRADPARTPAPRRSPSSSGRAGSCWPPRARPRARSPPRASSLSSRRAATSASPIRPAALIRGATANDERLDVDVARRDAGRREERRDAGPRLAPRSAPARGGRSPASRRGSGRGRRCSRSSRGRRGPGRRPGRRARRRGGAGPA